MYEISAKCISLFNVRTVGPGSNSALFYSRTEELVENTSVQLHEI